MAETPEQEANEAWLETLGAKLTEVTFYSKGGQYDERHVADASTIYETVAMTCNRLGGMAVVPSRDGWALIGAAGLVKLYKTKEAAEMVAIHRG